MSELKLRRLTEHNERLKEDLNRPRVKISDAAQRLVLFELEKGLEDLLSYQDGWEWSLCRNELNCDSTNTNTAGYQNDSSWESSASEIFCSVAFGSATRCRTHIVKVELPDPG